MAVQLFKDGQMQNFNEHGFEVMLDAGWSLTPEEANEVVDIIHEDCGDTVEDCECENPEVSVIEPVEASEPTLAEIVEVIGQLDPNNTEHWTNQDKPMVVAIETLLGKPLLAGQRNEAWEIYKAS
jgi:hypothetical protein